MRFTVTDAKVDDGRNDQGTQDANGEVTSVASRDSRGRALDPDQASVHSEPVTRDNAVQVDGSAALKVRLADGYRLKDREHGAAGRACRVDGRGRRGRGRNMTAGKEPPASRVLHELGSGPHDRIGEPALGAGSRSVLARLLIGRSLELFERVVLNPEHVGKVEALNFYFL